jgi:hypothetical protein
MLDNIQPYGLFGLAAYFGVINPATEKYFYEFDLIKPSFLL